MSKAMLIIDMPKYCDECSVICEQYYSAVKNENFNNNMKPDNCPLRELPQKQTIHSIDTAHHRFAKDGWNACLNEILGQ